MITPLYSLAHYCVLRRSPKNFESLKWFLYFHVFCTTIEWFCAWFLIDIYDFEPSIVLRIDGVLRYFVDSVLLFRVFSVVEDVSSISALFLFCNRLIIIVNMARRQKSVLRQFSELLLYSFAFVFCLWSLPFTLSAVPENQQLAKKIIIETEQYYPDCPMEPNAVVVSSPVTESENFAAEIEIASWVVIGLAIIVSAKISYSFLERRTKNNMSEVTKKMNKKFSQRTVFQITCRLTQNLSCSNSKTVHCSEILPVLVSIFAPLLASDLLDGRRKFPRVSRGLGFRRHNDRDTEKACALLFGIANAHITDLTLHKQQSDIPPIIATRNTVTRLKSNCVIVDTHIINLLWLKQQWIFVTWSDSCIEWSGEKSHKTEYSCEHTSNEHCWFQTEIFDTLAQCGDDEAH
ncbi:hypothetical protein GCK72_020091 [Caenorhabditis remanei]|uniref:Uncharacterized protein n=1 Tax=Caenorhabditis remanei TaxID=31234 RepID=A0A6A5GFK4_CAERE|nr:hypothetical protein GCK72_020091 [Caenorhabditis remanei]KAF1753534.1 hypothetical protein GCK72_020091 [Caenorhabditis remanei]